LEKSVKSTIYRVETPCHSEEARSLWVNISLHLQGRNVSKAKKYEANTTFLLGSFFEREDGDDIFLPNVGLLQNQMAS
jgi:hypothetical protein